MGLGVLQGKEYRREDQKNVTQAKQATGNRISRKHGGGVGSAPTRPTTVRLVNVPVVSPSLRGGNSPSVL